jgi:hypothetical protein
MGTSFVASYYKFLRIQATFSKRTVWMEHLCMLVPSNQIIVRVPSYPYIDVACILRSYRSVPEPR